MVLFCLGCWFLKEKQFNCSPEKQPRVIIKKAKVLWSVFISAFPAVTWMGFK